jgi:hypothetical protein
MRVRAVYKTNSPERKEVMITAIDFQTLLVRLLVFGDEE